MARCKISQVIFLLASSLIICCLYNLEAAKAVQVQSLVLAGQRASNRNRMAEGMEQRSAAGTGADV